MEGQGPGYILKTNTNHFNLQLSPTGPILTAYSRRTNDFYGDYFFFLLSGTNVCRTNLLSLVIFLYVLRSLFVHFPFFLLFKRS